MTEKDFQIISEQYKDEKEPLYEKIHQRVEEMYEHEAKRKRRLNTFSKVFPVSLAVVLIISLAIILPIVLQPAGEQPGGEIRYSDLELDIQKLDCNLSEYAIRSNSQYLYINFYDVAEDLSTLRYFKADDDSVTAYLQESFIHGEYGYLITLSLMRKDVIVDKYDEGSLANPQEMIINNVTISYDITRQFANAQFEYQGYKYYLEFDDAIEVEFLTEIINNMFSTQQATA